jgi:beta-D-xylosidase 4
MFDKPEAQPAWAKYGAETVNTPANRETVLAAAAQGLVLLVNKAKALPLKTSAVKRLALVGPNVQNIVTKDCGTRKEPSYLGCEGCYCANAIDPISPRTGFAMHAANVDYVAGCTTIMCDPEEKDEPGGWQDAATAAGKADATVVIVGLDVTQECEGHDRMNVTAPGGQNAFVAEVCNAAASAKKPCIVLIMAGSAVDLSEMEALPSVDAVMWVGYPGEVREYAARV